MSYRSGIWLGDSVTTRWADGLFGGPLGNIIRVSGEKTLEMSTSQYSLVAAIESENLCIFYALIKELTGNILVAFQYVYFTLCHYMHMRCTIVHVCVTSQYIVHNYD